MLPMTNSRPPREGEREITDHVFANSPNMLALCVGILGLIKIYAALQRVTTLADNFLLVCVLAFLLATVFSYLALRLPACRKRAVYSKVADYAFLSGLISATAIAIFIVVTLAG
jgi:hypothetical protein